VLVAQDWTCKIADFGLANVMRKDKEYHDRKFLPGSLPYMAPEVTYIVCNFVTCFYRCGKIRPCLLLLMFMLMLLYYGKYVLVKLSGTNQSPKLLKEYAT
jgi:serine/threonine protein kinase